MLNNARTTLGSLQDLEKRAKPVVEGAATELGVDNIKEVASMIGMAKKAETLVKNLIASVGRLG